MTDLAAPPGENAEAPGSVRLAELVAALSLGVDLGFGQPMEHVLRQCLIALRLADRISLAEADRSVVCYTALLVNVGCHADAHEQARWFGGDIELRSQKYDHPPRSLGGALAALRLVGSGNPPLHRFLAGVEFGLTAFRGLDGMIAGHAALACALATELGLPQTVQAALGASYEQWDGRGWPGKLSGEAVPVAARLAQLAEYAEVAHRVGGTEAARELARQRGGGQFDPGLARLLSEDAAAILSGLDQPQTWDAVIAAEPSQGLSSRQGHSLAGMFKGLPGDACPCPHWGYLLAGQITVRYADHEEVIEAGDAFYMPPGHVPEAASGTEIIQFSRATELAAVKDVMAANMSPPVRP